MKKRLYFAVTLVGLSVLSLPGAQTADVVYISSQQAKVHKEANLKSKIVAVLSKSDQVEVVQQQKVWMQVKITEISGWISRYSVSRAKPFESKASIFSRLKNFFQNDNRRVRLAYVSTAGGVRDLTEEESDAAGKTDFKSLRVLEDIDLGDAEIDAFIAGNAE